MDEYCIISALEEEISSDAEFGNSDIECDVIEESDHWYRGVWVVFR